MNILLSILTDVAKMTYYTGTSDLNLFWSCMFYGYYGVLVMILIDVSSRNPLTAYSPVHFSWSYFWRDNVARFLLNILLVAAAIRFLPELLSKPINQFYSLLIGIGADRLAALVKKKKNELLPEASTSN